ncbi:MAG: VaFE repeat-containing surface-anchored protein [Lactococcus lactis]|uniref:VaFE repeat-containing surface-anchored protein n=1 Tax=Lactococcus lactis subsp. lactis TaxID=1360 RepID=A0A1V0P3A4_LACLL|nr:VaFE repeat-containing surface-anchored protein [Lactococcus lactis]MDN6242346.1 VaFE repeat-containing surface-anchored protein [Tetragenococcus koreensis]ARE20954.1 VaFE repeat-containing surface-anchored protein [Lactococcus lactis subsp. lactis]MDH8062702.1 VaFE repeat-containing surface-anchored protein [Lactococcus lactis subsp. lactis]MDN6471865.1 VaFE repeat-containing surface-anchored protein [Lactococcus lactis]MDN6546240.1 VaFE repeat-containing surface-anchored protein [Lactococ
MPDGETKAHDMEVDILPDGTANGAPDDYEFKVIDETTHHVLTDQEIPVSYDPTKDGLLLLDDNNLLGKFNLGQIKDNPIMPPTLTTNAFDEATNKTTLGLGQVTIGDNVTATNVSSAKTLTGVLVDSSGNPVKDNAGNVIQKSETVSADNQGNLNTTLVLPSFDDEDAPNSKYTVEETLLDETGKVLVADKNYQNNPTETVTVGKVPTFSTQLSDNVLKFGNNVLQDKISGSGYEAGQQVQINVDGMIDASTNKVLPATGSAVLTADEDGKISGEVSVNVVVSDAALTGHHLTALESALLVINGKTSTKPVAKADNPTDKNETGTVTKIPDGATQVATSTVQVGQNTIEDRYQSSNGSYVSGTLVLVKAGEWDVTKNKVIPATGEATLTADENGKLDGKIPVTFTLDNSEMGDTIVTTEAAYLVVGGKQNATPVAVNDSHTDKKEMVQLPDFQPHKEDNLIAGTDKNGKLSLTSILEDLQELQDDRQNISNFALTNQNWDLTTDETSPTYQAEVSVTAKNPAVNRSEQNCKMNNNNRNVLLGQTYDFPLMLDVRNLNQSAQETEIQMTDLLPTQYLNLLLDQVTIQNSEGKVLDPNLYTVSAGKETKGKTPITIAFKATKEIKEANGKTVKIVDTTKIPLGERYFIDLPVSVKDSTPQGTKIVNTASETLLDTSGHQVTKATETRQNQVVTPSGSTKVEQNTLKPVKDATYVDDWTSDKDRPLTVGQTYTVKVPDFIWDKTTNQEVKATGSVTFVATAPVMTVKIPIQLDASSLSGHDLVTMEDLYMKDATTKKDIKVAQFRDKNAASETVHVEKPNVPQTPQTPKTPLQVLTSVLPKTGDKGGGLLVALGALVLTSVAVLKRKALVDLKRKLRRKLKK